MKIDSYKKSGKTHYRFQIRLGKKVTRRSGFKSKNEAIFAYTQMLEDYNDKTDGNLSYIEAYQEWIKVYKTKVKETTLENTLLIFKNHILPVFKDYKMVEITPEICQQFALSLVNYTKGKNIYNYAKSVANYAVKLYGIKSNPFDKAVLPKFKSYKKKLEFLEADQAMKLISYYKDNLHWYTIFRILILGGLRRGELLALEWSDVDFANSTLSINKNLGIGANQQVILTTPKNTSSIRVIDLDQETLLSLKELKLQSKSKIIFPNKKGEYKRLSDIDDRLKSALKDLGFKKIRVHDLRHTCASLLFASGADIKYVQKRLGHARIETTLNIYTHTTKENDSKNLKNFINYLEERA